MQGGDEVFGVAEGSLRRASSFGAFAESIASYFRSFIDGKSWLAALIPKPTDFIQAASLPTVSLILGILSLTG